MCMMALGFVASIGGAVVSAMGQAAAADAEAEAQKRQAAIAYRQSHIESAKGGFEQQMQARKFERTLGSQNLAIASSGVYGGNSTNVVSDSTRENAITMGAIDYNAKQQQSHQIMQGNESMAQARATKQAAGYNIASTLIQPFTKVSNLGSMFNYG